MTALLTRGVHLETVPEGTVLARVHRSTRGCIWFGPAPGEEPEGRWDAPGGEFRTLYAGLDLTAAFAESVLHRPVGQVVARQALAIRSWSEIRVGRDLQLAQFRGAGLLKHGISAGQVAGDYDVTQALALEVFQDKSNADGIIFRSTHNNDHCCVALFNRVAEADLIVETTTSFSEWGEANWLPLLKEHGAILDTGAAVPDDFEQVLLGERAFEEKARTAKS